MTDTDKIQKLEERIKFLEQSLRTIHANAQSQIEAMDLMKVPEESLARRSAVWYYQESRHALIGV